MTTIRGTPRKYYTISEYVDIDTGEIISKNQYEREYYKIKTTKTYENDESKTIIRYTSECRNRNQTRIKFD